MDKIMRKSIRKKVTRRAVVAMLVTVIALSVVNMVYLTNRIIVEQEQELKLATELTAGDIEAWTMGLQRISCGIAESLQGLGRLDEKTIGKIINEVAREHTDLFFVYVGTENGDMYMARGVQFPVGRDVRERPWYKEAKSAGHTIITNPYVSASRQDVVLVTIATPIYFGTNLVGVVGIDSDIATINSFMQSIDFKNGAYGFLIDREGDIIAHPNTEFLPTSSKTVNVADVMPEINSIIQLPSSDLKVAEDYQGVKMVYNTMRLEDTNWIIGVAYPEKNIIKIIDKGLQISVILAVLCIILSAFDMRMAIKRILAPIEKINPAMDKIMEGDFSTQLEFTKEQDELGLLQSKMATMMESLTEMINKQKYVLGEMEKGNLIVEDIEEFPGELNEIAQSVNSIKAAFNDIISDIQFSAINLQSFSMAINESSDLEEMRSVFEELSAEANALMEKTSKFKTM